MPDIVIERTFNGKSVDVSVTTSRGLVAYEVQMPNSVRGDLLEDLIAKDIRAGFIKVVVCVQRREDVVKVNAVIAEMAANPQFADVGNIRAKVEPKLLADFLGHKTREV